MLSIREIVLVFLVGLSSVISYNVAKVIHECDEVERKTLIFDRDTCKEEQRVNAEIKGIQDEEIPDIDNSVGQHSIVL